MDVILRYYAFIVVEGMEMKTQTARGDGALVGWAVGASQLVRRATDIALGRRASRLGVRLGLLVLVIGLTSWPRPARAQTFWPPWPAIVPVTPGQSRPVPIGSPLSYVAATITAQAPIVRLAFWIDGVAAPAHTLGRDEMHISVIYQPRGLVPGVHVAYLIAWDAAGYYGWREWNFTLTG